MSDDREFLVPEDWNTYLLFLRVFGEEDGARAVADLWESRVRDLSPPLGIEAGRKLLMGDPGGTGWIFLMSVAAPPEGTDGASARVEDLLEALLTSDDTSPDHDTAWGSLHGFVYLAPGYEDEQPARVGNGIVRDRTTGEIRRVPAAPGSFTLDSLFAALDGMDLDESPGSDTLPNEWDPVPEGSARFDVIFRIRGETQAATELYEELFSAVDDEAPGAGLTWVGSGYLRQSPHDAEGPHDRWDAGSQVAAPPDAGDPTRSAPVETLAERILARTFPEISGARLGVFAYILHAADGGEEPDTESGVVFLREPATGVVKKIEVEPGTARSGGEAVERWDDEGAEPDREAGE